MKKLKPLLNLPTRQQLNEENAKRCKSSFYYFLRHFWDVIVNETPIYNWHIKYICDEVQLVADRVFQRLPKEYDLIINIPPATTKSTIVTVMYPVWCWINDPSLKFITGSYSQSLSIDHAQLSRDIIRSQKFKDLFPDIQLRDDRDAKQLYANTSGGARMATSVGGTSTGKHAHILIVDDPTNPKKALSDIERANANRWLDLTLATRKVDKQVTPLILIMQRLHEDDCTGHILAKGKVKVKHICLPATVDSEIVPKELKSNYVDGMLDPIRLNREVLQELRTDMGSYGYAGQMLQAPAPQEGGIFKKKWFGYFTPVELAKEIQFKEPNNENPIENLPRYFYSDTAYGKEGSDNSATACYSVYNGDIYVWGLWVVNLTFPEFRRDYIKWIRSMGYNSYSICRFEPKASGISTVQELKEVILPDGNKLNVKEDDPPSDSKQTRAMSVSPVVESGHIKLLKGSVWIEDFLAECAMFPNAIHDDQVDVLSAIIRIEIQQKVALDISFV